ncbi:DUF6148 family protein [Exiguobacterium sp. MMG028]|uniref:DUF6148 family protein n=1 Tax=unclassified Exiguobacterium TaxID=2644629 RepID=UPI000ACD3C5A|nr:MULTISPECIES: DUF6148 family protein [unclassified Exiguobacterium]MDA5559182.1 DUF6148 family protein [Exiguobacterium sp. MMG028]
MNETTGVMTLQRAKTHLEAWYQADLAVSTGKSYTIGSRSLTRADMDDIRQQIKYWEGRVAALSTKPRRRAKRIVPRDL